MVYIGCQLVEARLIQLVEYQIHVLGLASSQRYILRVSLIDAMCLSIIIHHILHQRNLIRHGYFHALNIGYSHTEFWSLAAFPSLDIGIIILGEDVIFLLR